MAYRKGEDSVKKANIVTAAAIFLLSLYLFKLSYSFPPSLQQYMPGPGFWPRVILVCLMGLCIILFCRGLMQKNDIKINWNLRHVMPVFILGAAYLATIELAGYFAVTVLLIAAMLLFLGFRNWKLITALSAGWIITVYLIFVRLLGIPLN
ncbi:MAG: hypothetical protein VR68_02125 [Peptococcaceae bacterium BRH_c4a]|nr:MAG: hypothetical protein VR68_02125 [Peptococcaceae bacterium BRH_c4a]